MEKKWTVDNIPDLTGKVVIVTGANNGIGFETAKTLTEKGALVVMACRNMHKAYAAADLIRQKINPVNLDVMHLDLADQDSVREFADAFKAKYTTLNILINNAGVMIPPFTKTRDGYELQFGTNHLGHFALTLLLMDVILATPKARVVNVSSSAHQFGKIDFDNLNAEKGYNPMGAYAQSKLANLLFTRELNRYFLEMDVQVIATSAHPGWTVTGLQKGLMQTMSRLIGQSPAMGALPTLRAAIDPDLEPNDYCGPEGMLGMRGYPEKVSCNATALDDDLAKHLWNESEKLTGISYTWSVPA